MNISEITTSSSSTNQATEVEDLTSQLAELETQEPKNSFLQDTDHEVDVVRINEDEPLLSVTKFEELNLDPNLLKGIYEMGFTTPSKIQAKALPLLIKTPPQNMIGQSQSGTGKTAAFVLTMLSRIDSNLKAPQALCLAPSRELARQIMAEVKKMAKFTSVTTAEAIRDSNANTRMEKNRGDAYKEAQLIVGTPGTVYDLIKRRYLDQRHIKIFVLDEADNMLDQQGLATYKEPVRAFAGRFAPNANEFSLKVEELSVKGIKQFYMDCKNEEHKLTVLNELYSLLTIGQSIIFVEKRITADEIAKRMTEIGHKVINLHGGLSTTERDEVMDGFRKGSAKVLIATNVIARGIDILQVNLVINFDIPIKRNTKGGNEPDYETYLHRIGRTGRFGREGIAINLVSDETSWKILQEIANFYERGIEKININDGWDSVAKFLRKEINAINNNNNS
ncbi:17814_t:CDS:2 [Acaulospora morrowiae]|uniref:RNA helicase n=1 Tax=Acaulospora morrowiae TaxID=94023 RepID=A0A9N8V0G5_9GLOM|nr:17814_t:CDS:2 [Acaulospora morrowiae]